MEETFTSMGLVDGTLQVRSARIDAALRYFREGAPSLPWRCGWWLDGALVTALARTVSTDQRILPFLPAVKGVRRRCQRHVLILTFILQQLFIMACSLLNSFVSA